MNTALYEYGSSSDCKSLSRHFISEYSLDNILRMKINEDFKIKMERVAG